MNRVLTREHQYNVTVAQLRADRRLRPDLRGNISLGLWGDISPDLRGNITDLRGDITGLWGDITGLRGDIDEAGLTSAERAAGVDVEALIIR